MKKIFTYGAIICAIMVMQVITLKAAMKVDAPIWEYMPDAQNLNTSFFSSENVKVYKFSDKSASCYVAMSPLATVKGFTTSISCVK